MMFDSSLRTPDPAAGRDTRRFRTPRFPPMSQGVLPAQSDAGPEPFQIAVDKPTPSGSSSRGLWIGVGLAVAVLAASGVARGWQASRVDQVLREGRKPPFALKDIPMQL